MAVQVSAPSLHQERFHFVHLHRFPVLESDIRKLQTLPDFLPRWQKEVGIRIVPFCPYSRRLLHLT